MPTLGENFDKGLVTSRDASLLGEGELSRCDDAHYRPNDSSLAPVRARADVASASNSHAGLKYLQFDGVLDRLLLQRSGNLETLNVTGGGRTEHKDGRSVVRLEAVHYDNKYMVANGVDDQFIFTSAIVTGASNASGIFPMGFEVVSGHSGGGINHVSQIVSTHADYDQEWVSDSLPNIPSSGSDQDIAGEQFWYWITEFVSGLGMESAATSMAVPAVSTASHRPVFFPRLTVNNKLIFASQVNPKATHLTIYRSVAKLTRAEAQGKGFATFAAGPYHNSATAGRLELLGEAIAVLPFNGAGSASSFVDSGRSTGRPYSSITATVIGVTQTFTVDQKPPTWDVAANYEDSIVVNDVNNKHIFRYSFPGKPWAFPGIYFVPLQTDLRDEVTCIAKLGDILVLGMKNNMFRVNFLPRENDGDFVRGRAYEEFSTDVGNQSKDGYAVFSAEGSGPRLAYVARDGIWITDGYNNQESTRDIDWEATVDVDSLGSCVLVNVPHLSILIFYYTPLGGTANQNTRALYFHYHPQHVKDGRMKVTGPVTQRQPDGTSGVNIRTNAAAYGSNTLFYAAGESSDGRIGKEDQNSAITAKMLVQTRLIYADGIDSESELQRLYLLSKNMPTAPSVVTNKIAWATRKADAAALSVGVSAAFVSGLLDRKPFDFFAEAFQLRVTSSGPLTYWSTKLGASEAK